MINVQEIVEQWNEEKPKYEKLGVIVSSYIKNKIAEKELLPEIHYRTKELLSIIKKIKKKQSSTYSFQDLKDKLGVRIICTFQEEMDVIDKFLDENFVIIKADYKQENIDFNKLDYVSNHYDVKINCKIKDFEHFTFLSDYVFEIQVRTLNQHAWSNTAHFLSYKQEAELPNKLKRKVYRLLSLYELADDEFSSVNKVLKQQYQSNPAYSLLRKLEGKFYKFAKFDYDREISLRDINTILNYFETDNERHNLINNIESFIINNEQKIRRIYEENRSRFHEILFLTQPEIFIIWYMLQNNTFIIEDNWECDFDIEDIEQIKTLWGNEI